MSSFLSSHGFVPSAHQNKLGDIVAEITSNAFPGPIFASLFALVSHSDLDLYESLQDMLTDVVQKHRISSAAAAAAGGKRKGKRNASSNGTKSSSKNDGNTNGSNDMDIVPSATNEHDEHAATDSAENSDKVMVPPSAKKAKASSSSKKKATNDGVVEGNGGGSHEEDDVDESSGSKHDTSAKSNKKASKSENGGDEGSEKENNNKKPRAKRISAVEAGVKVNADLNNLEAEHSAQCPQTLKIIRNLIEAYNADSSKKKESTGAYKLLKLVIKDASTADAKIEIDDFLKPYC